MKPIVTHYDYVFTMKQECVSFYQNAGCERVYYLPMAADPQLFRPRHVSLAESAILALSVRGSGIKSHGWMKLLPK
ncbi:MAG: hypothetical protein A2189_06370 [Paenibacillus sp. RIFOXYA1_FULL_44_5]|nr:MAG: hypothetical protein A2189_06370 [Paenibacillus sp. RIFOXYA1_FULL_44_5]